MTNNTEQMTALLPCPFCGETDITRLDDSKLGCTNCSAEAFCYDWEKRAPKEK
jgi:predicted RNA-binding Zn-ribbon protein involved in translation (DUF1610 family)